jgi:hypothetical protein
MQYDAILGPDDVLPERPFTDAANTMHEVEIMRRMLEYERQRGREWEQDGVERVPQHVAAERDAEGHRHLLVVPDTGALIRAKDVTAVGFFGRPRDDADHAILFELEDELISRMPAYGAVGLLSYYDVEMPKSQYGNLILFSTLDVPPEWAADEVHRRAVKISPGHYHEVRLHKGSVAGPLLADDCNIVVERTKYFDFKGDGVWHGLRNFKNSSV